MKILIAPFAKELRNGENNAKNYPFWPQLIDLLQKDGHEITQIGEKNDKKLVEQAKFGLSFNELQLLLDDFDTFIAVDSFFQHFAWYYNKPGIIIFSKSDPEIFGHSLHNNLLKSRDYLRKNQFGFWESEPYDESSFVTPEEVIKHL